MFRRASVLQALIALIALFLGLLVYLFDRQPEHVYFLSQGFALTHGQHPLFGVVRNMLPAFLHVYAFILLTTATFNALDLLSIALGTIAAYLTAKRLHQAVGTSSTERRYKIWRQIGIAGVTTLGLVTIAACGSGGSSTPDTTPPVVSTTNPADGATGVFVDGSIKITFSETMDPATVNPTTFKLEDANHTPVLTSVSYAGDIVTFMPISPQPLARSRSYTATITTDAKDLAGNALTAPHSWSFTTETDAWQTTNVTGAPTGRIKHTAVWTGSKMIVWGGQGSGGFTNTGGLYDPVADAWSATATTNAPAPRFRHTAVWDGAEMIVWGGVDGLPNYFNDGAAYDPVANGWSAIASPSSLGFAGRWDHTAVWTGTEMIVWGGNTSSGFSNDGAAYNPTTNTWRTLPSSGLLARAEHTAVWTGTEMIVWGGNTSSGFSNDGAAYNPATNSWRSIASPPAGFLGRSNHTAVWTGKEMIVWGGNTNSGVVNTGAAYDPAADSWRPISTSGAPAPRLGHTVVWTGPTGISMVVWGGWDGGSTLFNVGGRYDPATNSWKATDQTINVPTPRFDHSAVWTGSEMIVWGGNDQTLPSTGGRYAP